MPAPPCQSTATALRRDAASSRSPGTPPTPRRRREERDSASSAAHLRLAQGGGRRRRAGVDDIVRTFGGLALFASERAVTAVTDGEQTAQRHERTAGPDPADQRLDVDAHAPRAAVAGRLAQRDKQMAEETAVDARLGHGLALHAIDAFFRMKVEQRLAVLVNSDEPALRLVVGTKGVDHAVESEGVATDYHRVTHAHAHVLALFIAAHADHADNEHHHTEKRKLHAEEAARQTGDARGQRSVGMGTAQTLPQTLRHRDDDPGDHQHAQHHQQRHVAGDEGHGHRGDDRHRRAPAHAPRRVGDARLLPFRHQPEAQQEHHEGHDGDEDGVEVWGAHGNLIGLAYRAHRHQRVDDQRRRGAEQHRAPATVNSTLLASSKDSREKKSKLPPKPTLGARQANSANEPPTTMIRKARMNMPRSGSLANECTDVSTPDRTRKVPSRLSENAVMASSTVQLLKLPRFSVTASE